VTEGDRGVGEDGGGALVTPHEPRLASHRDTPMEGGFQRRPYFLWIGRAVTSLLLR
jgi:hypothetical protein